MSKNYNTETNTNYQKNIIITDSILKARGSNSEA